MTAKTLNLSADIIDLRDIIERIEELRDELTERHEAGGFMSDFSDWILNRRDNSEPIHAAFGADGLSVQSDIEELYKLESLMDELAGMGGDEQWEGVWYPLTLIRDSHFTDYAQELAEDCGMVDCNTKWPNNCIDWEQAARKLKYDYSSVEVEGVTYWTR